MDYSVNMKDRYNVKVVRTVLKELIEKYEQAYISLRDACDSTPNTEDGDKEATYITGKFDQMQFVINDLNKRLKEGD